MCIRDRSKKDEGSSAQEPRSSSDGEGPLKKLAPKIVASKRDNKNATHKEDSQRDKSHAPKKKREAAKSMTQKKREVEKEKVGKEFQQERGGTKKGSPKNAESSAKNGSDTHGKNGSDTHAAAQNPAQMAVLSPAHGVVHLSEYLEGPGLTPGEHNDTITSNSRDCLLYTSPSPRDQRGSRMPSSA